MEKRQAERAPRILPRVSTARGGPRPGIDLDRLSELQEIEDLDDVERIKRFE